jgi:outer membrane protein assembly factor BamB
MAWMASSTSLAGDWRGLLGNQRDGAADAAERIPAAWMQPTAGKMLAPAWRLDCGSGYAGVAVASSQVVVFDREGGHERVRMVRAADGHLLWTQRFPTDYRGGVNPDDGPRCVPTITPDHVVVYGAAGELHCLSRTDGSMRWSRALRKEYNAEEGYFGAGSTPLVLEDRVIVNVGGKKQGGVVAVDLNKGKTLWAVTDLEASYASPIRIRSTPDRGEVFVATRLQSLVLKAADGHVRAKIPFGSRGPTVNAATPVQVDPSHVFLTASYGIGACLVELGQSQEPKYRDSRLLASQYSTPVLWNGKLWACDGREDIGPGSLCCIDFFNRKVLWTQEDTGIGNLMVVDGKILAVQVDGRLLVLDGQSDRYQALVDVRLPPGTYRALPAFAEGTLFVRDCTEGRQAILAFR